MLSDRHQGRSFPRSAKYHRPPYPGYWSTLAANHPSTSEKTKKKRERTMSQVSVLGAEARRLAHVARPSSSCSPLQNSSKPEIFGNFVASRSAGPFVGRHFLLERHFAGEMISVGKARRCPFKYRKYRTGRNLTRTFPKIIPKFGLQNLPNKSSLRRQVVSICKFYT